MRRPVGHPRLAAGLAVALAAATVLVGCGADEARPSAAPATTSPAAAAATPAGVPVPAVPDPVLGAVVEAPDVVAALTRALGHRADDLRAGDRAGVLAGLATRDPAFTAQQEQYQANLAQLPLQAYTLTPDPATLVRDGTAYAVNVAVGMQLAGFDTAPVTTVDRYRFVPTAGGRRYLLASVTDAGWEQRNGVRPEPWDDRAITVATGNGVLGIFDAASAAAAGPLVASVESGIADVSARVPYPWSRTVVFYAFSDDAYLRALPTLPGEDPDALDAVAVPVQARPDAPDVVGTRLVLHPRMLRRDGAARDRLLRHELTHAAVGTADDHAPVWLSEGLAEWVSVQAQAPQDRRVPRAALRAARAGFTDLPVDVGFNDPDDDVTAAHYALSWWAVEQVAAVAGPAAPWGLLDQLEAASVAAGGLDRATEDATLTAVAGVNMRTLARKAGKLLLATSAPPAPVPVPAPTPVPPAAPVAPPPV